MCTSPNSLQNSGLEIEKKGNDNAFTLINYLPQMLKNVLGDFFLDLIVRDLDFGYYRKICFWSL